MIFVVAITAWIVFKYEVFHGPYFTVFGLLPYSIRVEENTEQKKVLIWTLFTR